MDADRIETERMDQVDDDVSEHGESDLHLGAMAIGAGLGMVAAAFIFGSLVLILVLLMGAVAGGLVAAAGAMMVDRARGKRVPATE